MNIYISGDKQNLLGNNAVYEKSVILREQGHTPINSLNLRSKFKRLNGRLPSREELEAYRLEVLSDCGGIIFLQNWETSPETQRDYEYAVSHNLVIFEVNRLSSEWGR